MRDTIRCTAPATATPATGTANPGDGREYVTVTCGCGRYSTNWNVPTGHRPTPAAHVRPGARLAEVLRDAAAAGQYGHSRTPDNFYLRDPRDKTGPGATYWIRKGLNGRDAGLTDAEVLRLGELAARYRRLVHLAREVWPHWEAVGRVHYADNSIEEEQVARDGRTRRVMVLAPGGDRCF